MEHFEKIFERYGGSYAVTMERFMGNETMYLRILGMLFEDENLKNLKNALSAKDFTGAFTAAHTLKGVTSNLGLAPLYQMVCKIVEPLRRKEEREDYEALYNNIHTEFQKAQQMYQELTNIN